MAKPDGNEVGQPLTRERLAARKQHAARDLGSASIDGVQIALRTMREALPLALPGVFEPR